MQTTHDYFGVLLRGEESDEGPSMTLATAIKEATGARFSPHSQLNEGKRCTHIVSASLCTQRNRLWQCTRLPSVCNDVRNSVST
jgi:hypothetical protein